MKSYDITIIFSLQSESYNVIFEYIYYIHGYIFEKLCSLFMQNLIAEQHKKYHDIFSHTIVLIDEKNTLDVFTQESKLTYT